MDEESKFKNIIADKAKDSVELLTSNPEDPYADPNANPDIRRAEEKKEQDHKNVLFFKKALPLITVAGFLAIILTILVILPISEMSEDFDSVWGVIQDYSRALRVSTTTIIIAVITVIVSDLLKLFYAYIKKHLKDD